MVKTGLTLALTIATTLAAATLAAATELRAEDAPLSVGVNDVRMVRLARPARNVVVGNPAVADVTVENPRLLMLFGKRPGGTRLSVLDAAGNPILDAPVVVDQGTSASVTVLHAGGKSVEAGGKSVVFDCAERCVKAEAGKAGGDTPAAPAK